MVVVVVIIGVDVSVVDIGTFDAVVGVVETAVTATTVDDDIDDDVVTIVDDAIFVSVFVIVAFVVDVGVVIIVSSQVVDSVDKVEHGEATDVEVKSLDDDDDGQQVLEDDDDDDDEDVEYFLEIWPFV